MEVKLLVALIGIVVSLAGWVIKGMKSRIDRMEDAILKKVEEREVRMLISDKLEPHRVEFHSLSRRMDEIREFYKELDNKVDRLLELCKK